MSSAAPSEEPIRCPVWSAAPAAPPMAGGTSSSVRVKFGEMTPPPPSPATSSPPTSTHTSPVVACWGASAATTATPVIMTTSAPTVSRRCRCETSRPAMGAVTAAPSAKGVSRKPVSRALSPRASWRWTESTRKIPVNPVK